MEVQQVPTNNLDLQASLDKVKHWTCQLLSALDLQLTRMFRQPGCVFADDEKVRRLTSLVSNAEALCRSLQTNTTTGDISSALKQIEDNLRETLLILFQMVTQKSAPTDIVYFKMFSLDISSGTSVDFLAISFFRILFLLSIVGFLLAFMRTGNTQFSNMIEQLRSKTLVFNETKTVISACISLVKLNTLLLMTGKGNVDRMLPAIADELNKLIMQPTQGSVNNAIA